jgi:hypothetical protein
MSNLVCIGKTYELRGDDKPGPIRQPGDLPAKPQKARVIKRVHLSIIPALKAQGTGYRPGKLLDLAHDQCRYTVHGTTMCGAKVVGGSYCEVHRAICYPAYRRFLEAAE